MLELFMMKPGVPVPAVNIGLWYGGRNANGTFSSNARKYSSTLANLTNETITDTAREYLSGAPNDARLFYHNGQNEFQIAVLTRFDFEGNVLSTGSSSTTPTIGNAGARNGFTCLFFGGTNGAEPISTSTRYNSAGAVVSSSSGSANPVTDHAGCGDPVTGRSAFFGGQNIAGTRQRRLVIFDNTGTVVYNSNYGTVDNARHSLMGVHLSGLAIFIGGNNANLGYAPTSTIYFMNTTNYFVSVTNPALSAKGYPKTKAAVIDERIVLVGGGIASTAAWEATAMNASGTVLQTNQGVSASTQYNLAAASGH